MVQFFKACQKQKKSLYQQYFTFRALMTCAFVIAAGLAVIKTPLTFAESLPQQISFQHLLENKDITLAEVQGLIQDSQGFIWIGSGNGLIRFDGYDFKSIPLITEGDKGPETHVVRVINGIFEDSEKTIWVATRAGLLRYDPGTEKLTPVPDDPLAPVAIATAFTWNAKEIPSGELLVATQAGLIALDRKTNRYNVFRPQSDDPNSIHHVHVNAIHVDAAGQIWIGTEAGLEKLDWATKTFMLFKPYPEHSDLIPANSVVDIIDDAGGALWVATFNGLVHFNPITQKRTRYIHNPLNTNSVGGNEISKLLLDSRGALWITTDGGGLSIFEKNTQFPMGQFVTHKYEAGRSGSLSSNQVRTILEDRNGDIWIGHYPTGIDYYDRSSAAITSFSHDPSNPNSVSHNSVQSLAEDAQGNLWIGTDGGGLNYYNRKTNQFTRYKNDPHNSNSLGSNTVLSLYVDNEGQVWSGSWGAGITKFNPATGEFFRIPFDSMRESTTALSQSQRFNNATVWSIKEDSKGYLWIGSHLAGLSKLDRKTGIYTHYQHKTNDPASITDGVIWTSFEDTQGRIWVGASGGLSLLDQPSGTFTQFKANAKIPNSLTNPSVLSIHQDRKHRLWFGTEGGLHLLQDDEKTFKVFNKSNGLANETIKKIVEDQHGRLWLSTLNGVSVFDPDTYAIKNYNRNSGRLMGSFHIGSGMVARSGEIVFGGIEGMLIFDVEKLVDNKAIPPIVFTDLKIFADSIVVGGKDRLLPQSLNHTKTLTLDYQKTMFEFAFSALNFRDANKNKYSYMLDGFDSNWLDVGDRRTAKYTNLNSGTYVFRVKGSNNDGLWNDQGAAITIVQLPPPWKTWWAYTIYVLMLIAIIMLFVHSQRKKRRLVEEQNRLLEIKVAERTVELREKNNHIQAMLSNMHQGLFTVEASGNIHQEYSVFLENIFETKEISGRNAMKFLFGNANLGSDTFDSVKVALDSMIGEDELNFGFNKHLLLREYSAEFTGNRKYLSLDWDPIVDNNVVNKLMVSVRDVTQLKQLESDALSKKRELDIISQLLNIPTKKYLAFSFSAKRFIAENRDFIARNHQRSDAVIAVLFRNMHTIKGNCRTFGFRSFSDCVHDVESVYSALKADPSVFWDREQLLADLTRVENLLQEYENIFFTVLRRGDSERDHNGFWADSKAIETIQQGINAMLRKFPQPKDTEELVPIQLLLNAALSTPFNEVLTDVEQSLSSIALQLNKEVPRVIIDDNHIRIKSTAIDLITNVFTHILRNSVDHGIETPAVRRQAGKPASGTIKIRSLNQDQKLYLYVKDDGQGINIDRLFAKGVEVGQWAAGDKPGYNEIANLIFASGISTKEQVTDISGRGVGMDAVKQFLLEQNANIKLHLLGPHASNNILGEAVMVPFELVIELPSSAFIATV
ncbi:MAG: two-component regulator propeller domain-containing protein [Pseudomonadota bacterium]